MGWTKLTHATQRKNFTYLRKLDNPCRFVNPCKSPKEGMQVRVMAYAHCTGSGPVQGQVLRLETMGLYITLCTIHHRDRDREPLFSIVPVPVPVPLPVPVPVHVLVPIPYSVYEP